MATISICLTDLGDLTLSSNVDIYTNVDNFTTPVVTNVPITNLIGSNCSYTLTVPDGTTIIQISDPLINCNTFINVNSSDFCDDCNLRFDVFSSNTVSRIVAGNLITDCSGLTITDYIIDWYGPNSTTNIAYTSGFGTEFPGYSFTHPLVGPQAIFAQAGSFFPQIRFIKINGIIFSQSGGTGSVLADLNSCLSGVTSTVDVFGFTCTNGVSSNSFYTHEVNFTAFSNGTPPIPLDASVILSSTTKYFAFAFKAFEIPDTLTFTFSGSAYSDPIVIESIKTGSGFELQNPPFNGATLSPSVVTKSAATYNNNYIGKVLCLTGLTINNGDVIIINVTPNQNNFQTNWTLFFNGCLTNFDCDHCFANESPGFKISGSTIQMTNSSCESIIQFRYSGCNNTFLQTDFYKGYFYNGLISNDINTIANPISNYGAYALQNLLTPNGITPQQNTSYFWLLNNNCVRSNVCINVGDCQTTICSTSNNNYIRYVKSNTGLGGTGIFEMYFSNVSDYNYYLNNITTYINTLINNCSTPYVNDPSNVGYFKYFKITIPSNVIGQLECGDGNIPQSYFFHVSTQVTTAFNTYYEIKLTMPTITNLIPIENCSNCKIEMDQIKNNINNSSTNSTNIIDIVTNRGSRYSNAFEGQFGYKNATSNLEYSLAYNMFIPKYINETYMYSGAPLTLIPSLTAETCDLGSYMYFQPNNVSKNNGYYGLIISYYTFYILNQLKNIARINTNGIIDTTFNSEYGFNSDTRSIALQSDGKILVAGSFTSYNFNGANRIIRLNSDGTIDTTFLTNIGTGFNGSTTTVEIQSDGKILFGGNFTLFDGNSANRIIRLNSDGTIDTTFLTNIGTGFNGFVSKIKIQPDGKILCVGGFTNFNGSNRNFIIRLLSDGTIDSSFTYTTELNNSVSCIDLQSDGKILIGGNFTAFGATITNYLLRLNTNGTLDTTFATNLGVGFNSSLTTIKIQSDDKIVIGGLFSSFNNTNTNRLIRLESNGFIDNTFLTNIGTAVFYCSINEVPNSIEQQIDGKIIIAGGFKLFNSNDKSAILRLNIDGTIDNTFSTITGQFFNGGATVFDVKLQPDGKILTAGFFNAYDNFPNNLNDFGIATYQITNGQIVGLPFSIYKYSGGTVTYSDPTYIV